jgi:hypothetical protein
MVAMRVVDSRRLRCVPKERVECGDIVFSPHLGLFRELMLIRGWASAMNTMGGLTIDQSGPTFTQVEEETSDVTIG